MVGDTGIEPVTSSVSETHAVRIFEQIAPHRNGYRA